MTDLALASYSKSWKGCHGNRFREVLHTLHTFYLEVQTRCTHHDNSFCDIFEEANQACWKLHPSIMHVSEPRSRARGIQLAVLHTRAPAERLTASTSVSFYVGKVAHLFRDCTVLHSWQNKCS